MYELDSFCFLLLTEMICFKPSRIFQQCTGNNNYSAWNWFLRPYKAKMFIKFKVGYMKYLPGGRYCTGYQNKDWNTYYIKSSTYTHMHWYHMKRKHTMHVQYITSTAKFRPRLLYLCRARQNSTEHVIMCVQNIYKSSQVKCLRFQAPSISC